jgi:hypothetical protein
MKLPFVALLMFVVTPGLARDNGQYGQVDPETRQ